MNDNSSHERETKSHNRREFLVGAIAGSAALGAHLTASGAPVDADAGSPAGSAPSATADIVDPYTALALQLECDPVNQDDVSGARRRMASSLQRVAKTIRASTSFAEIFHGRPVKLVVLPEYFLTGFPLGESTEEWARKAALDPRGKEYETLSEIAQANSIYLSGNAYEIDQNFPELYFQTSFIIAPSGDLILRYRRLISMFTPTPYDVWDRYVEEYGREAIFPVVDTDIGRLACIASEEILYPELARCLAMRGAEVFCHSSSEAGSTQLTPKDIAKRARAIENLAIVVSANTGGLKSTGIPESSTDGMSKIVGIHGEVIDASGFGESQCAARIDITALRSERKQVAMTNLLARQPFQLYHESYRDFVNLPPNTLENIQPGESARHLAMQRLADAISQIEKRRSETR